MITKKIDQIKGAFFDSAAVKRDTDKTTRRALSRFGAFVRTKARQSIRKREASSSPGSPPSSHTGLLKKFIYFAYEPGSQNVVIGPVRFSSKVGDAPEALEYGGTSTVVRRAGRAGRRSMRREKTRVRIEARPFMQPAFEAEQSKLPTHWQRSVRG